MMFPAAGGTVWLGEGDTRAKTWADKVRETNEFEVKEDNYAIIFIYQANAYAHIVKRRHPGATTIITRSIAGSLIVIKRPTTPDETTIERSL